MGETKTELQVQRGQRKRPRQRWEGRRTREASKCRGLEQSQRGESKAETMERVKIIGREKLSSEKG